MGIYYVYRHITKDTLEPFYVGKGQANRFRSTKDRNEYWYNKVNKHKFIPEIIQYFDDEDLAFIYEEFLIYFYKSIGYQLVNLTTGGEGHSGHKHSKETKDKISKSHIGKIWPEEQKQRRTKYLIETKIQCECGKSFNAGNLTIHKPKCLRNKNSFCLNCGVVLKNYRRTLCGYKCSTIYRNRQK